MTIETALQIWTLVGLYLGLGFLFSLMFVTFLVGGIDPDAKGIKWGVRLLLIPGVTLLWPLMLAKTVFRKGPPVQ